MTPQQAEAIINNYCAVLARGVNGDIGRKLSWFPCSICKIRIAFYIYLKELIA